MDREPEELQFVGFFGVFQESYKLVLSWRRIFSKVTLALILPLSLVFLFHIYISSILFAKIRRNEHALEYTPDGSAAEDRILSRLASEWTAYLLFKGVYLLGVLVFALLSTSAVVYTVACVYTAKDLTFPKVMAVVPKVWKRLMVTFLWTFLILLAYITMTLLLAIALLVVTGTSTAGFVALLIVLIAYSVGLVYISVVWHLASVVSVLEDSCGIAAMQKSRVLIRGKLWLTIRIFLLLNLSFLAIEITFKKLVAEGHRLGYGVGPRIGYGALLLSLLCLLILLGLVIQTVIYFVCKSFHHESIDKSSLADHLEVYLGEYVPLRGKDVQMEQYHV